MDSFLRDYNCVESSLVSSSSLRSINSLDRIRSSVDEMRIKEASTFVNFNSISSSLIQYEEAPSVLDSKDERRGMAKNSNIAPPSHVIEDKGGRKMDFQVKGKLRDDNNLHLRLRIADFEGSNYGHEYFMMLARFLTK